MAYGLVSSPTIHLVSVPHFEMFTTFGITTPNSAAGQKLSPQPRPRRAQVSRACDWCRLARVKCDSVRPCRNCKQAGHQCVSGGRDDFKSVAAATREVQKLRAQVEDLEAKLLKSPSLEHDKGSQRRRKPPGWKGIWSGGLYYGPSSLAYFVHRLSSFITLDLKPGPAEITQDFPQSSLSTCDMLNRRQQDAFLDLFWQGYHVIYPGLDEGSLLPDANVTPNVNPNLAIGFHTDLDPKPHLELRQCLQFRQHYESLWESSSFRRPCPLVDIVLALCIQSGSTYISHQQNSIKNSRLLGNEFFSRAQNYLHRRAGSPSLLSAQCYFFSALYLLAAGQIDSAYHMGGSAIRMSQSLGIYPTTMEHADTRSSWTERRLWNSIFALDVSLSLHLGRPLSLSELPESANFESNDAVILMGPTFKLDPKLNLNWLSFETERHKLFTLVREVHEELDSVCERILEEIEEAHFYDHPPSREKCASFLLQQLKRLKTWAEEVPEGLKTPRQHGVPFSVDRSPLDLSGDAPLWLQRQRLILELEYHNYCILLCRKFITFSPTPTLGTLSSDNNCIMCVNHAIAATNIMHQVLSTDILVGWFQVRDWQTNAMFALAGFASGYPVCPATPSSRKALAASAAVFETIGSLEMANLARRLDGKISDIIKSFTARLGLSISTFTAPSPLPYGDTTNLAENEETFLTNLEGSDDPTISWLWGDFIQDLDDGMFPANE